MWSSLTARSALLFVALTGRAVAVAGDGPSVSDLVTLKDGQVLRGEVVDSGPRTVVVVARRDWVREHLTEWPDRWEAREASTLNHTLRRRRERLDAWLRDRAAAPGASSDRLTARIDAERDRLESFDPKSLPLISLRLGRFDVKGVESAGASAHAMLRLGWLSDFPGVEEMSPDALRGALEGRGFRVGGGEEPSVASLLPPEAETETVWLTRRGATEVLNDHGLRFVRYQGMLLPDSGAGVPAAGVEALGALRGLLGGAQADPLPGRLREVERSGKVGVLLTRLDIAPDLSAVTVEVGLLVRTGPGRWVPAGTRLARFRPDDLPDAEGDALAADPQVAAVFRAVESLGLGGVSPGLKQRSLGVGAATRRALGAARGAAERDLNALALPALPP